MNSHIHVEQIYATDNFKVPPSGNNTKHAVERVDERDLKKISALATPYNALALCRIPVNQLNIDEFTGKLTLALDGVQDPGNFGTIIRIADWFGIENIICSHGTVDVFNPKVIQATMGSIARINIHYCNFYDILTDIRHKKVKIKIYCALIAGENIYTKKLSRSSLIIVGNESKGISEKIISLADEKISIPSFAENKIAESLNVACSAAIICAEFRRFCS
jgi:TrmH family RNA methyltransferase